MKKLAFYFLMFILGCMPAFSQELLCKVTVNTQLVEQTSKQVFSDLEKNLQEFVNQRVWTDIKVQPQERISCALGITVQSYNNGRFLVDFQIQSFRPIYGTSYLSPVLNFKEKSFEFSYQQGEPLYFNEQTFTSDLVSVIAYYAYLIIGLQADTLSENAGIPYYQKAFSVVLNAQNSSDPAWKQNGENNRWAIGEAFVSERFGSFHKALYGYHRQGLDLMQSNPLVAKTNIENALFSLGRIKEIGLNTPLLQLFFDAKSQEIANVFSANNQGIEVSKLKKFLENIAPTYTNDWQEIKK